MYSATRPYTERTPRRIGNLLLCLSIVSTPLNVPNLDILVDNGHVWGESASPALGVSLGMRRPISQFEYL